jgi:hypothetical protein
MRSPKEGTKFSHKLKETWRNDEKKSGGLRNRSKK